MSGGQRNERSKSFPFFFCLLPASASLLLDVLSLGVYIFSCVVLGVEASSALMKCGEKLNRRLAVCGHLGTMSSLQRPKARGCLRLADRLSKHRCIYIYITAKHVNIDTRTPTRILSTGGQLYVFWLAPHHTHWYSAVFLMMHQAAIKDLC